MICELTLNLFVQIFLCRLNDRDAETNIEEIASTPSLHRWEAFKQTTGNLRRLQVEQDTCDAQFVACLQDANCVECFVELETKVSRANQSAKDSLKLVPFRLILFLNSIQNKSGY